MKRTVEKFLKERSGSAVVEATILLPIIIMTFIVMFLLSVYLPSRAVLQRATQHAATGIATAKSDSTFHFTAGNYQETTSYDNVYAALFAKIDTGAAEAAVKDYCRKAVILNGDDIEVDCGVTNYVIYKEVYVTATQSIKSPIKLSFLGLSDTINLTVTSMAVVQNGDEFVRTMDIAADFTNYLADKAGIDLSAAMQKVHDVMNFINNT